MSKKDFETMTMGELSAAVDGYSYHMANMENWNRMVFHVNNRSKKSTQTLWKIPYLDKINKKVNFYQLVAKRSGEIKFLQSRGFHALWDAMSDAEITQIRTIFTSKYVYIDEKESALKELKPFIDQYHLQIENRNN